MAFAFIVQKMKQILNTFTCPLRPKEHSRRGDGRSLRAGRWGEGCSVPSSGHNKATGNRSSKQPWLLRQDCTRLGLLIVNHRWGRVSQGPTPPCLVIDYRWILERARHCLLSCSDSEPTRLQRILPNLQSHKGPWLNSVSRHKTSHKCGNGTHREMIGGRIKEVSMTVHRTHHIHIYERMNSINKKEAGKH